MQSLVCAHSNFPFSCEDDVLASPQHVVTPLLLAWRHFAASAVLQHSTAPPSEPARKAEISRARWRCRWKGPANMELAVKRIDCANALQTSSVRKEQAILEAAEGWSNCVGGGGCFWAPWQSQDGVRGTTYYLTMECAPTPAEPAALRSHCSQLHPVVHRGAVPDWM